MTNDKIIDYIELCLNKGYSIDDILKNLKKSGWSEDEIHDAIDVFTENMYVPHPDPKNAPNKPSKTQAGQETQPLQPQARQDPMKELRDNVPQQDPLPDVPQPVPSKPGQKPKTQSVGKGAKAGFGVSLVAGIMMALAGISNILIGFLGFSYGSMEFLYTMLFVDKIEFIRTLLYPEVRITQSLALLDQILIIIALAVSIIIIYLSVYMKKPGKASNGGKLVLMFSFVNMLALWGFSPLGFFGGIIGVVGGILGILKK